MKAQQSAADKTARPGYCQAGTFPCATSSGRSITLDARRAWIGPTGVSGAWEGDSVAGSNHLWPGLAAFSLALLILLLAGCSSTSVASLPQGAEDDYQADYRIAPGDVLAVFVWDNPDLSIVNVPVRPDGKITTPLAPDVRAADRTASELAQAITQKLSKFVRNPDVTVTVTEFVGLYSQQVRVVGDGVKKPKSLPYREGMTLLDVIIAVGGMTEFADGNEAILVRTRGGRTTKYRARLNDLLKGGDITANARILPGDILIVPEATWL